MKRIFLILIGFVFVQHSLAQAPQGINYQGVARDNAGAALSKTNIAVQFKLYNGNPSTGTLLYSEVHPTTPTDTFGLYSLVIGSASGSGAGTFSSISWSGGNIWVEVWIDPNGGGYQLISQQQLMSVPYALYAQTSGSGGGGSVSGSPHNVPRINNNGNGLSKSLIWESADSSSIGVNTTSPLADALVEMVSPPGTSGKGLLIPRMTDAQRTSIPVSNLHHGLLVFQTNSAGILSPEGFWYYDAVNTNWLLLAPAQAVWTLSGNATGTGSFLGSIDNNDIVFKTGLVTAIERMRIYNSVKGGNVQFGNAGANTHYIFPAAKGNAGDILQLDPTGSTNNLVWKALGSGSALWTHSSVGGALYPSTLSDSVGIGTSSPQAALDVYSPNGIAVQAVSNDTLHPAANIFTTNIKSGYPALDVNSASTLGNAINATANNAYALSGSSNDASALWLLNNSGGSATIDAMNNGTHSVAYFHNSSVSGASPVLFTSQGDPNGLSAEFTGGVGIQVTGASSSAAILGSNTASGDGVHGTTNGGGSGLVGDNGGNGAGILGVANGTGAAGVFQVLPQSSTANALDVSHSGKGIVGNFYNNLATNPAAVLSVNGVGTGPSISAGTSGTGSAANFLINNNTNSSSALNVSTNGAGHAINATNNGAGFAVNATNNGNGGGAGNFQVTAATSSAPAFQIGTASPAPALRVAGAGTGGSIAAMFNGGSVGIGTGTVNPASGLDVRVSLGVQPKKYTTAASITIPLNDPNTVHLALATGTTTFVVPDATACPGRILVFTFDSTGGSGSFSIASCCSQLINGLISTPAVSFANGMAKPSIGIISDGANWQIIFKN